MSQVDKLLAEQERHRAEIAGFENTAQNLAKALLTVTAENVHLRAVISNFFDTMASGAAHSVALEALKHANDDDGPCTWRDTGPYWATGCGNAFWFEEGGPEENDMRFCPYCGKPLKEATS